jgi:membrane protease YdiL (CAAX protease family)
MRHAASQDEEFLNTITPRSRSPLRFFLLVFALTIPFWLLGAIVGYQILPGVPVSAFMFVCPVTAAVILVYRENKTEGVIALLKRSFDTSRIRAKIWYAPIILLPPVAGVLQFGLLCWTGTQLPIPRFPVVAVLAMSLAFFLAALGEELGWSGYIIDPMQDRWGALPAAIFLGLLWAIWHIVPLVQARRSPTWIAWWCLGTVAARILIVWLYNNTGKSVFAATAFHTMVNISWQLFPINGSYFDPRINGLMMAVAAAVVIGVWGPRALALRRNVRPLSS